MASSLAQPMDQLLDRLGLVAGRLKRAHKLECRHEDRASSPRNPSAILLLFTLDRKLPTAILKAA